MEKTYIATQKYLIMSPRKIRLVVDLIKNLKPLVAIEKLPFVERRAGEVVSKVIKNALASARNQGANESELIFKEIQVGEGPRLKRGKAASRGRWHPFKKRMSHIRVVLTTKAEKPAKTEKKLVKTEEVKEKEVVKTVKVKKERKQNGTKS